MTAGTEKNQKVGKTSKKEHPAEKETVEKAGAGKKKDEKKLEVRPEKKILGTTENVGCKIVQIGNKLPTYLL